MQGGVEAYSKRLCVLFPQRLLKQLAGRIYLIEDGRPLHRSGNAMSITANGLSQLRRIRLPATARNCPPLMNGLIPTSRLMDSERGGRPTEPNS